MIDEGRENVDVFRTLIRAIDACCYRNPFSYVTKIKSNSKTKKLLLRRKEKCRVDIFMLGRVDPPLQQAFGSSVPVFPSPCSPPT